jgi:abortive infection bacteriophage resistance protein
MKYTKPALSLVEQADLLISRGMLGDREQIIRQLSAVNYYRLSGYWHTFRLPNSHDFSPNTTFDKVWMRYVFDRRLRLCVMDALERLEVYFRGQLAYHFAHEFKCPFAYAVNPLALPNLSLDRRTRFLAMLADDLDSSKEVFVAHFRNQYGGDHPYMPVWVATEIMTFGNVLTMYQGAPNPIKMKIAAPLGIHDAVLSSWLLALNTIRNICAHHSRLWNRKLGNMPMIPKQKNDPNWRVPIAVGNDRVFGVLTILKYCLDRIAPQSSWSERLFELLDSYSEIPLNSMGFPQNWQSCPIWLVKSKRSK